MVFHPSRPGLLLSGATDGLVNVYDTLLACDDVDDLVLQTCNSESSVVRARSAV